jgi:hypothetical protein
LIYIDNYINQNDTDPDNKIEIDDRNANNKINKILFNKQYIRPNNNFIVSNDYNSNYHINSKLFINNNNMEIKFSIFIIKIDNNDINNHK